METRLQNRLSGCIRRVVGALERRTETDQELLRRFVDRRDESAFTAVIRRHGPMVLRVAWRTLQNEHDAEDVFQATFLVLSQKADTLRRQASLGSWLYGVAYRLALKAKAMAGECRKREQRVLATPVATPLAQITVQEAQAILDQELNRLPKKLREPVVLCCLEGLARDEAAQQIGCPASVLKSRLEQARERLRQRLLARGLTLPCGWGAFLLLEGAAEATVARALIGSTARAANAVAAGQAARTVVAAKVAALTEGMVQAMGLSKLQIVAGLLLTLCLLGAGARMLTGGTLAAGQQEANKRITPQAPEAPPAKSKEDKDLIVGTWKIVSAHRNGKSVGDEPLEGDTTIITADAITMNCQTGGKLVLSFHLNPSPKPKAIDVTPHKPDPSAGDVLKGIYELKGDKLTICFSRNIAPGAARPSEFLAKERGDRSYVLERVAQNAKEPEKPKDDRERLQGSWHIVEVRTGEGPRSPREASKDQIWVFTRDKLVFNYADGSSTEMAYQVDPKQTPKAIDLAPTAVPEKGYTFKGIYEIDGDRLTVYYSRNVSPDAKRPARFDSEKLPGDRFFVLKRAPKKVKDEDKQPEKVDEKPDEKPKEDAGLPIRSLSGHTNRVTSVAYSSDGTAIATASGDGTARGPRQRHVHGPHGGDQGAGGAGRALRARVAKGAGKRPVPGNAATAGNASGPARGWQPLG